MDHDAMRERWLRDGALTVEGLLDEAEVAALCAEAAAICRGARGPVAGLGPDRARDGDDAVMARTLALHFPHKLSGRIRAAMAHSRLVDILRTIIGPNVKAMQTMLFFKHAGMPGQAWHQDENFIPTRDRSLAAAWIALDDATVENGCLWIHPGSHRSGILWPDRVHGDPRFDSVKEAFGFPHAREGGVPLPVRRGGCVLFHGYLLHRSLPNRAAGGFRRALVVHTMAAESLLPWDAGGRLSPTRDNRDIVMICGSDPYAAKGTVDLNAPFVRAPAGPSVVGGDGPAASPTENAAEDTADA